MKKIFKLIILFILIYSCATVVPPSGGNKDVLPPMLIKANPINGNTNIFPNKITLYFDELISKAQTNDNFIFSPSINYKPKFSIIKNKLNIFIQKDSLKQNTTYNIELNNFVMDINEGNILDNLSYTFSTGSFLDSLCIIGKCINSYTNEPIKKTKALLVSNSLNSQYQTLSDKSGNLKFNNLRKDNYFLTVYVDNNNNNYIDTKELFNIKKISFENSKEIDLKNILLYYKYPSDSLQLKVLKAQYLNQNTISIKFNRPINNDDDVVYEINNLLSKKNKEIVKTVEKDSFLIFFPFIENDTINLKIKTNNKLSNINLKQPKNKTKLLLNLQLKTSKTNNNLPVIFESNIPIASINSENILINGIKTEKDVEIINSKKILIKNITSFPAQIVFKKKSLKDINGYENYCDTFIVEKANAEETGNISLIVLDTIDKNKRIILLTISNENYEYFLKSFTNEILYFKNIIPGNYNINIIFDENSNGVLDIGNIEDGKNPERHLKLNNFLNIKPNWDIENVNINLN
ncbi:MAG: Ig-like domain-containing protein [Bacteroidia bacterium]|nr:Ig-like domain-containing protein [Bacteroidia bacterium]